MAIFVCGPLKEPHAKNYIFARGLLSRTHVKMSLFITIFSLLSTSIFLISSSLSPLLIFSHVSLLSPPHSLSLLSTLLLLQVGGRGPVAGCGGGSLAASGSAALHGYSIEARSRIRPDRRWASRAAPAMMSGGGAADSTSARTEGNGAGGSGAYNNGGRWGWLIRRR